MTDAQSPSGYPKHFHSFMHRGLYCLAGVSVMLLAGTLGMHFIEGFSIIDSFYFTSMIATGQGPAPTIAPSSTAGKLFTCVFAFASVGSMVAALGFLFGPFFGGLWRLGTIKLEKEIEHLQHKK